MKQTWLEKGYIVVLLIILLGIVAHAPLSVGLGTLFPDYSLFIKSWKEILMVLLVPVAGYIIVKRGLYRQLYNDLIIKLITVYAVLHLVMIGIFSHGAYAAVAGLAIDLRYLLFFVLVYVAVLLLPIMRRKVIITAAIGAFIVVGFASLQLVLPPDILTSIGYNQNTIMPYLTVDKNPDYIRINSTMRGPNPLGAYAGIVLAALTAFIITMRAKFKDHRVIIGSGILGVCSLLALWHSYSRSAWIGAAVAVAAVLVVKLWRSLPKLVWITSTAALVLILGGVFILRDTPFISNVILHENPEGGSVISSNDGHVESLQYGIGQLLQQPFGQGVGSTGSASLFGNDPTVVENQFLFVAHETGWLGMILFISIVGLALVRLYQQRSDWFSLGVFASGVGLVIIGLLQPVWVDDTVSIVWWALAATAIAGGKHERKSTKQKTA